MNPEARAATEQVFRSEWGRILAGLIRWSGSFDLAEDALQDAFATALATWTERGIPDQPAAWITVAAQRKLLDKARRQSLAVSKSASIAHHITNEKQQDFTEEEEMRGWPDDRLRLMFTCCHPSLNLEAQVALCLRMLGGLTVDEIARAFLVPETTLAQRLVRAKRKIRDARIPYEVPPSHQIGERLSAVQAVIYLVFNEGYLASTGGRLVRLDLASEAIRLGRILVAIMPGASENHGLLALMLLHHSRRDARMTASGDLVTLEEQDRSFWHQDEIAEAISELMHAAELGDIGPYSLQAGIAAEHARASSSSVTDWNRIADLYTKLMQFNKSAILRLNHAAAVAMGRGLEQGLALMDQIASTGELNHYYLLPASRADLLRRLDRLEEAESEYRRALDLVTNDVEKRYLQRRIEGLRKV